jgi:hypothetical protein
VARRPPGRSYGHRTVIAVSLVWAGIATLLSGVITGLVLLHLIGETGAVRSPAVSGVLRDATGAWSAAVFVDAGLIAAAVLLLLCVRERAVSRVLDRAPACDAESRLGPRVQLSRRTVV